MKFVKITFPLVYKMRVFFICMRTQHRNLCCNSILVVRGHEFVVVDVGFSDFLSKLYMRKKTFIMLKEKRVICLHNVCALIFKASSLFSIFSLLATKIYLTV